jgi:hypothetical protein
VPSAIQREDLLLGLGQDQIQGQVRHGRLAVTITSLTEKGILPRVGQAERSATRGKDSWLEDSEVRTSSLDRNILGIEQGALSGQSCERPAARTRTVRQIVQGGCVDNEGVWEISQRQRALDRGLGEGPTACEQNQRQEDRQP